MFFFLFAFGSPLRELESRLKIGIIRNAPDCKKFIEDNNWIYVHLVARVEGREQPVLNTYNDKPLYMMVNDTRYIKGINLGLRGACEHEVRKITIPPELAYGDKGVDGLFPPQSSWTVEAEILEILKESTL